MNIPYLFVVHCTYNGQYRDSAFHLLPGNFFFSHKTWNHSITTKTKQQKTKTTLLIEDSMEKCTAFHIFIPAGKIMHSSFARILDGTLLTSNRMLDGTLS